MPTPRSAGLGLFAGRGWRCGGLRVAIPGAKAVSTPFLRRLRRLAAGVLFLRLPVRRASTIYHNQRLGVVRPLLLATRRIGRIIWQSSTTPINRADKIADRLSR